MSKAAGRYKPGQKVNGKGRSRPREKFVMLQSWMLESDAYRALCSGARALYIELAYRFNGMNNGSVFLSCREASIRLGCSKDSAGRWFQELEAAGFIRARQRGSFGWKSHLATEWILTEHEYAGKPATKDFMRQASAG